MAQYILAKVLKDRKHVTRSLRKISFHLRILCAAKQSVVRVKTILDKLKKKKAPLSLFLGRSIPAKIRAQPKKDKVSRSKEQGIPIQEIGEGSLSFGIRPRVTNCRLEQEGRSSLIEMGKK